MEKEKGGVTKPERGGIDVHTALGNWHHGWWHASENAGLEVEKPAQWVNLISDEAFRPMTTLLML